MAGDDFNENDQVDLSSDGNAASEVPSLSEGEQNIEAALDKYFGAADDSDLAEAGVTPEEVAKEAATVRSNIQKRKAREAEQRQELREEGLEGEDELDDESVVNGEEDEVPAIQDNDEATEGKEDEDATEGDVKANALDPALRYFAATELRWSDDKIDKLIAADPELAASTIQSFSDAYTNLSRQYLAAPSQVAPGTEAAKETPAQPASPTSNLDKIYANLNEFAEANGEELAEFMKALKTELIDPWRKEQAKIQARDEELSKTEARTTFGTLSTKFASLYGEQGKPRSPEQQKAVTELAEVADQLRAGAKQRGQELSISDAINRAHLLVSHNHRESAVRNSIKEQVQKRAKGMVAKPTYRRNPVTASGKSREAAGEALTRKAAELGIGGFDE